MAPPSLVAVLPENREARTVRVPPVPRSSPGPRRMLIAPPSPARLAANTVPDRVRSASERIAPPVPPAPWAKVSREIDTVPAAAVMFRMRFVPAPSRVTLAAPGPSMVTASVMVSCGLPINPVSPGANTIVSGPGWLLASRIACARLPAPDAPRFVT